MRPARTVKAEQRQASAAGERGVRVSVQELRRLRGAAAGLGTPPPGIVSTLFPGAFRAIYHGRGLEFHEARGYQSGDDFRSLDWRVTARTGRLHTKIFQEEREHSLHILLDSGPSMWFGTRNAFKWVVAARVAALFGWIAVDQGDRLGATLFGTGANDFAQPARRGESNLIRIFSLLARFGAEPVPPPPAAGVYGLGPALNRLQQRISPGSLVLILSDFQHPPASLEAPLSAIAQHSEVAAIAVYDPLESKLPDAGRLPFTDGEHTLELDSGNSSLRAGYHNRFRQQQTQTAALFHRHRSMFLRLGTHEQPAAALRRQLMPANQRHG